MRRVGSRWKRRINRSWAVGLIVLPWSLHSAMANFAVAPVGMTDAEKSGGENSKKAA